MKDRCGFLFVRYKRHRCTELVSWDACSLSAVRNQEASASWWLIKHYSIVISISATASVRYREVVCSVMGDSTVVHT